MIRFIVLRRVVNTRNGVNEQVYETVDAIVPELESLLRRGGTDEDKSDISSLVACELREEIEGE